MKADLHTHTNYSDGIYSPKELLAKASSLGLSAIAITDHDTIEGAIEAKKYEKEFNIEVIIGCEFSCYENGKEYHILGYNLNPEKEILLTHLKNYRNARLFRAKQINKKLNQLGYNLEFDYILEIAGAAPVARPHIAQALVNKGYVENLKAAFLNLIGEGCPAYHPKALFTVKNCISLINKSGGIAVLAHPRNYVDNETLYDFIDQGLDGIEVYHPSHSEDLVKYYHYVAMQYWLVETAGSDFHGNREYDEINFGNYTVDYKIVENIKYISSNK